MALIGGSFEDKWLSCQHFQLSYVHNVYIQFSPRWLIPCGEIGSNYCASLTLAESLLSDWDTAPDVGHNANILPSAVRLVTRRRSKSGEENGIKRCT